MHYLRLKKFGKRSFSKETLFFIQDGTLRNGDHLLAVGDVRLWGMGAEQVASILRQAGQDSIRLVSVQLQENTCHSALRGF